MDFSGDWRRRSVGTNFLSWWMDGGEERRGMITTINMFITKPLGLRRVASIGS